MGNELTMADDGQKQLSVRLSSKDGSYAIPSSNFFVPSSWRRFHLSELINRVLEHETPVPFDFVIDGKLLRSSLAAYCAANGVSEESIVEIEYLPSTLPPQLQQTIPTQDWISDIELGSDGSMLRASYDSTASLSHPVLPADSPISFSGDGNAVLSACRIKGGSRVATAGMGHAVDVWQYTEPSLDAVAGPAGLLCRLALHADPVASVRAAPSGASPLHLVTADWGGLIGLWDLSPGAHESGVLEEPRPSKRRRRKAGNDAQAATDVWKRPVSVLRGHAGKISRAVFDRTVSLWDTREDALTNISLSLSGHAGPVASVAAHPTSSLLIASASHDATAH